MMVFLFWGDSGGVELCGQFKRGGGVEDDIFVVLFIFIISTWCLSVLVTHSETHPGFVFVF